jgi:CheY-like chemotaxis protein
MLVQRTEGAKIIILLDINMPVLDGWGFLEEIKK